MSTRQIRRLQNIVKASTGADADDEDYHPPTMKLPKSVGKSKAQRKAPAGAAGDNQPQEQQPKKAAETSTTGASPRSLECDGTNDEDRQGLVKQKPTRKTTVRPKSEYDNAMEVEGKDLSFNATNQQQQIVQREQCKKKRQNKRKKARRREEELEEELLLEAALREREKDTANNAFRRNGAGDAEGSEDLLGLLSLCNPQMLNSRSERIRRFGAAAVEDLGDGRTPARRPESRPTSQLFEEHMHNLPRFRSSVLSTPNRYCWPRYDGLGTKLVLRKPGMDDHDDIAGNGSNRTKVYYLDVSAPESQRADADLAECEKLVDAVDGLMGCLGKTPYHIPTLIVVSNVFETMGNVPRALEVIDLALYHLGVLLQSFPLRQTARQRCVPFSIPSNKQLFQVLRCGIHHALRKAAVRTAWETCKLLYSLDPKDPFGSLFLLDYLALRSKGWAWLVHVYYLLIRESCRIPNSRTLPPTAECVNSGCSNLSNHELALSLSTLPGFFFSAALAKLFLEREEATHTQKGGKLSRVIRDISPAELHAFHDTPPSGVMLADAIGRFPSAAVLLVEKVGSQAQPSVAPAAWKEVVKGHMNNNGGQRLRVATLWVARNAEMWNAAEPSGFLRRVITEESGVYLKSLSVSAANPCADVPTPWEHEMLREEDLMGTVMAAIPAHLLDPNEVTAEDAREEAWRVGQRALTPSEQDMLLRFRALYGELPPTVGTPVEQLALYEMMFETDGRELQMVQQQNHIALFLRTFLPWNNTRDMALREALRAAGIDDPVAGRNRQRRLEEIESDEPSDTSEWVTDSSWNTEESSFSLEDAIDGDDEWFWRTRGSQ